PACARGLGLVAVGEAGDREEEIGRDRAVEAAHPERCELADAEAEERVREDGAEQPLEPALLEGDTRAVEASVREAQLVWLPFEAADEDSGSGTDATHPGAADRRDSVRELRLGVG